MQRRPPSAAGQVVDRRPQSTGGDDALGSPKRAPNHCRYSIAIIADGMGFTNVDAGFCESLGNERRVSVDKLTEQQLGPNRDQLNARHQLGPPIPDI
jgi:hypothetical protein